jgi:agmatinase
MPEETPFNFCGLPEEFSDPKNSAIVLLPVPFDETSTWLKGADRGPDAIIEASRHLELYDRETNTEVYRKGICTAQAIQTTGSESMIAEVYATTTALLRREICRYGGGEHSVSIGAIRAHSVFIRYGGPALDAHADLGMSMKGAGSTTDAPLHV